MADRAPELRHATTHIRSELAEYRHLLDDTGTDGPLVREIEWLERQLAHLAGDGTVANRFPAAATRRSDGTDGALCRDLQAALNRARGQLIGGGIPHISAGMDEESLAGAELVAWDSHRHDLLEEVARLERAMAEAGCPI